MTIILAPKPGSKKNRKRIGRGNSSGQGTYAGRGLNGQLSRKGGGKKAGFEGGQTPLIRRLPKKHGFQNPNRMPHQPVNLRDLNDFDNGTVITVALLKEEGLIKRIDEPVKLLGDGECAKKLTVPKDIRVSASAKEKIVKAGGTVEESKTEA